MVIDYSEPYKDEIHNLLVKYGLNWTHSPAGIEFYKTGVDDTCNIAGYFTKKEYDRLVNWIKRNNISEEICMMLNSPLGGRRGIGFGLGRSWQRKSADWWLAGGIPAENCIAAYQPKGAASYAASKINLASPGMYDAIEGVAPNWDAVNGWKFNGTTQYLNSGVIPENDQTWSMIVRFNNSSGIGNMWVCGINNNAIVNGKFYLSSAYSDSRYYANGGFKNVRGTLTNGVMAVAGNKGYLNGSEEVTDIVDWSGLPVLEIYIGGLNFSGGIRFYFDGDIQALAIHDIDISSYITSLTDAISAF